MQYLRLYGGALPTAQIYQEWEMFAKARNCGALCVFTGIVRQEKSKESIESNDIDSQICDIGIIESKQSESASQRDRESTRLDSTAGSGCKQGGDSLHRSDKNVPKVDSINNNLVSALSFDVYEPLLHKWFESWQAKARAMDALLLMAHSVGEVAHTQSSYMCAVISRQRKAALALYEDFIEDFKANAPIWKYDVIGEERVFALSRSTPIDGSGVLG